MDSNNWRPNPSQCPFVGSGGGGGVGVPGGGGGEADMDSVDWRSQLQPDSRQRIINKMLCLGPNLIKLNLFISLIDQLNRTCMVSNIIRVSPFVYRMETLKRHLPVSGQEGLHELRKIAIRFEEKIYTAATSQSDYLRKISLKMLTMETKSLEFINSVNKKTFQLGYYKAEIGENELEQPNLEKGLKTGTSAQEIKCKLY
ncbi:mediator of rna polymerase ii transcription subunit 15a, partial [Quercus suber]